MKHIKEVRVLKNSLESFGSYTYTVGDAGIPSINLVFEYLFNEKTLKGREIICTYLLPNNTFFQRRYTINENNECLFEIHEKALMFAGVTKLKITLIDGDHQMTLGDDIIIKTKERDLGRKDIEIMLSEQLEKIRLGTEEVNKSLEKLEDIKKDIDYFKEHPHEFKGKDGKDGVDGKNGVNGRDGLNGKDGINGEKGIDGIDGIGIENISQDGNNINIELTNGATKQFHIETVKGEKGEPGKDFELTVDDVLEHCKFEINENGDLILTVDEGKEPIKYMLISNDNALGLIDQRGYEDDFLFTNDENIVESIYISMLINTPPNGLNYLKADVTLKNDDNTEKLLNLLENKKLKYLILYKNGEIQKETPTSLILEYERFEEGTFIFKTKPNPKCLIDWERFRNELQSNDYLQFVITETEETEIKL